MIKFGCICPAMFQISGNAYFVVASLATHFLPCGVRPTNSFPIVMVVFALGLTEMSTLSLGSPGEVRPSQRIRLRYSSFEAVAPSTKDFKEDFVVFWESFNQLAQETSRKFREGLCFRFLLFIFSFLIAKNLSEVLVMILPQSA